MEDFSLHFSCIVIIHKGCVNRLTICWAYNEKTSFFFQNSKMWLVIQNRCLEIICMSHKSFDGQKLMKMAKPFIITFLYDTIFFHKHCSLQGITWSRVIASWKRWTFLQVYNFFSFVKNTLWNVLLRTHKIGQKWSTLDCKYLVLQLLKYPFKPFYNTLYNSFHQAHQFAQLFYYNLFIFSM
jgi:hypothetical protein